MAEIKIEPYVRVSEVIKKATNITGIGGDINIGGVIVSDFGPRLAYIKGPDQFLKTYTSDGVTIPRGADISFINAYYLSYSAPLVLVRSMNTQATSGVVVLKDSSNNIIAEKVLLEEGNILDTKETFSLKITSDATKWVIEINGTTFYQLLDDTAVPPAGDKLHECSSIEEMVAEISKWDDYEVVMSESSGVYDFIVYHRVLGDTNEFEIGATDGLTLTPSTIVPATPGNAITAGTHLFRLILKRPDSSDSHEFKIDPHSSGTSDSAAGFDPDLLFDMTVDGDIYPVSLYPDAVDENGANCYIDNLTSISNLDFTVEVVTENEEITSSIGPIDFGDSGLDNDLSRNPAYLMAALSDLEDQTLYDIEAIAPFGITNPQFVLRYLYVGQTNKWFAPFDVPYTATNAKAIEMYMRSITHNSSNAYAIGPFDKNVSLTGWRNYIAASTLYWERVMANKSQNREFAPVFDQETGVIELTNPVKMLGKEDREYLLNLSKPVNYAIFDQRTNIYYINDNYTYQSEIDIMSEEMNRRMVNKLNKGIHRLMQRFKAKVNTVSTRNNVVHLIKYYIDNTFMTQEFKPEAYEIICDESNNTPDIIRANQLKVTVRVRLYNSIKYIEVLNEVYPIGVDFNS
jgi:hypothetical protein